MPASCRQNQNDNGKRGEDMDQGQFTYRYFTTYRGVRLPSKMVSPIDEEALTNRNTYVRAFYDGHKRLRGFEKWVYGEVELIHRYDYDEAGCLVRAEIEVIDEDVVVMQFDPAQQTSHEGLKEANP